jgi:hypothetical protein
LLQLHQFYELNILLSLLLSKASTRREFRLPSILSGEKVSQRSHGPLLVRPEVRSDEKRGVMMMMMMMIVKLRLTAPHLQSQRHQPPLLSPAKGDIQFLML